MSQRILIVLLGLASLGFSGCVAGGTGSNGGGATLVGGAVGTVCDPNSVFQGCYAGTPMQCEPGANVWKTMAPCPPGQFCIEKVDTASGKPQYRTASCVSGGNSSNSDASSSGGDASSSGDSSSSGDTAINPSDTSLQDTTAQDITGGDTVKDIAVVEVKPGPVCGNGVCEEGETKGSCSQDCGGGGPVCGNGTCEAGESQASCSEDCGTATPVCGNGACEAGETKTNCSKDCGSSSPICGNGACEAGETKTNCSKDCGSPSPVCGNGLCESGETAQSCSQDCKTTVDCCVQNGYTCGFASKCGKDCGKCGSTQTCTANKCVDNGGSCLDQYCTNEWDACVDDNDCVGIIGYVILNNCAKKFSCKDNACTQSNCSKELSQCQQTPACVTFATCVQKCTSDACIEGCFDDANGYLYDKFGQCAETNCP